MSKKYEPGMAFNMKLLNKVFAVLSVLFLITVIWVFLDDYLRPWKAVQVEGMKIKKQKLLADLQKEKQEIDQKKLDDLKKKLAKEEKSLEMHGKQLADLESELMIVVKDIKDETIIKGQYGSQAGAITFKYETANAKHLSSAKKLYKEMRVLKRLFADSSDRMKGLQAKEKDVKNSGN